MGLLILLLILGLAVLALSYVCYRMVFRVPREKIADVHALPEGRQYKALADVIHGMIDAVTALNYEDVFVQYEDNLQLHGKFYPADPNAPIEILFHGYQSVAERDFSGGLQLAREAGHNVLLVDQRAHGQSQGNALSFGIKESRDCIAWINYVEQRFGADCQILLVGISMGAATVLMAAGQPLPECVKGIIADSGYTSPADIIRKVMKDRHVPVKPVYPLIRLGGMIYGGFDIESDSAEAAMTRCTVPVLFIHGESDRFVPCQMSRRNYWACQAPKTILTVPGAGHGLSYMVDKEAYRKAVTDFQNSVLK